MQILERIVSGFYQADKIYSENEMKGFEVGIYLSEGCAKNPNLQNALTPFPA